MSEVADQTKPIIDTAGEVGSKQEVLDFLVTEEQLGVTLRHGGDPERAGHAVGGVPARAAERRDHGVPPRRGAQGRRRHALTTQLLVPRRGVRRRAASACSRPSRSSRRSRSASTCSASARSRARARSSARACAPRRWAPRRCTARSCGSRRASSATDVGVPNDVGFENFDWPTVAAVRERSRSSASATASESARSPAASTSTPATRSRAASARRSATPSRPDNGAVARRASAAPAALIGVHGHSRESTQTQRCRRDRVRRVRRGPELARNSCFGREAVVLVGAPVEVPDPLAGHSPAALPRESHTGPPGTLGRPHRLSGFEAWLAADSGHSSGLDRPPAPRLGLRREEEGLCFAHIRRRGFASLCASWEPAPCL